MKNFLIRSGFLFNIYFIVFLLFLHDPLLDAVYNTFYGEAQINLLGIVLSLIIVFDFIGTIIKIPRIYARANFQEAEETGAVVFPLWLGKTAITIMLAGMAYEAFGGTMNGDSPMIQALLLILVFKEMGTMIFIVMKSDIVWYTPAEKLKHYSTKELIADLMLWIYISVAYTAIWEPMGLQHSLSSYSTGEMMAQGFAAIVLFILIVIPLRMVYIIEEVILIDTTKERIIWSVSTALMLATAIWQVY